MQVDVMLHSLPCFTRTTVLIDINLIVFQAAPEALNDNVILGAALPIHADANLVLLEQINILRTGKMTPLVAVHNRRLNSVKRALHRLQNKTDLQALIQLPVYDVARIPVHDGVKIHPTLSHTDIGNIHTPDLIRRSDR